MRRCPRSLLQRGILHLRRTVNIVGLMALAACSEVSPAYDPVEWMNDTRNEVGGWFGAAPTPSIRVEAPPSEGRPFPNLATVPRPPQVTPAAERQQELERLSKDRASARAPAPPTARPSAPASAPSSWVGRVNLPPPRGSFSAVDQAILRQAVTAAATSRYGLRLVGSPEATAQVAAELGQMGLPPDLARSEPGPANRSVEIFVDY